MAIELTYKGLLTQAMALLSQEPRFIVCGYNTTKPGGCGGGTFNLVPPNQLIEMPLAECLNAGVSIGLSLAGYIPLLWIERMDFLPHALDAIVNHLDKLATLSNGLHKPACIIRTAIGKRTVPLFTGPTHTQDFSTAIQHMVSFPVKKLMWKSSIIPEYLDAMEAAHNGRSTMLVEDNDLLET